MSELILRVLLPLRPLTLPSSEWRPIALPFCLLAGERVVQSGRALPEQWPATQRGELILPSCDVTELTLEAERLQGLPRAQWREALPNMLEPLLLEALDELHFAISDKLQDHYRVAVLNRAWLTFLQGMVAPRGGAWTWYASHDGLAPDQSAEWRFPTLDMDEGYVVSYRDSVGVGGGWRGRRGDMGQWPLAISEPSALTQDHLLPHFQAHTEAFDIGPWVGYWRSGRLLWRVWRPATMALVALLLVGLLGPLLLWVRLSWQYHDLQQQLQQQEQRLGWQGSTAGSGTTGVTARLGESGHAIQMQGDFVRLAQDWLRLSMGQVNVTPLEWHYHDHRLDVRFGPGAQPDSLRARAQQQGWRWQIQGKDSWVLEEKQP